MNHVLPHQTIADLAEMLASRAAEVAEKLLPNGKRVNNEWVCGSVNGEEGTSLSVRIKGEKVGVWKDFAAGDGGDLVELWTNTRGIAKGEALKEIRQFLNLKPGSPPPERRKAAAPAPKVQKASEPAKPVSREYHQQLRSLLAKNAAAVAYLEGEKRGLTVATIEHFGLGLSAPYKRADGLITSSAVVAPMRSPESGSFLNKSAYICVPEVTQNPIDANGWMKGEPQCYYADKMVAQRILFVCEGLKDVWRHWQALKEADLIERVMLVSSTHGSAIPALWKTPDFWSRWDAVYLGQDNDEAGDKIAERVLELAGAARRVKVPAEMGKDWTDFWQQGGTAEEFKKLLDDAPVASGAKVEEPVAGGPGVQRIGRFSHRPVDINSAYVDGHLYYPTETHLIRKDEETGQLVERLETIVIRSDKTIHRAVYAPAPPGTPPHKRVLKLTDGTVIEKEPNASSHRSWDYESIRAYLEDKKQARSLKAIVAEILAVLKQSIWLPYEEDYVVLALTVPVTFLQVVFESVPLLLMNGPAGSGKSQTGNTMAKLCSNGVVIGQVSAASAARLIDETRGFVVLDDVESIAAKAGKDIQAGEFVQALKVSYNKHTAVKYWTDVKTMKTEKLDFFGVKLLSNTQGADSILGTRMIRIQTRKMPDGMKSNVKDFDHEDLAKLRALRNELHCWAFQHVADVDRVYRQVYENKTDRHAEISAPLRTMARLVSDQSISTQLETALARQHINTTAIEDDPVETLKEAVRNLIKAGYEVVTLTHLKLEMSALLDAHYGQELTNSIPEWTRPEWLGRQLRSNDLVANEDLGRKRFYGKNLRLVRFSEWVVEDVVATHDETGNPIYAKPNKDPEAFCQGCKACPYRAAGCELQDLRLKDEAAGRRPGRNSH